MKGLKKETKSTSVDLMNKENMKAIDFFSGAGGGSLGLEKANIEVVGAADIDEAACETYEKNLEVSPIRADLSEHSYEEILDKMDVEKEEVDILMGCPPCQNFSSLRDTRPWPEGAPKDELLLAFLDHIEEGRPKIVIFENVTGILNTDNGQYMDYFLREMRKLDYGIVWDIVNAAEYGVPQGRERVIAFGVLGKDEGELEFPSPTHPDEESQNTVRDVIEDLPKLSAGETCSEIPNHGARNHQKKTLERISSIPEDGGSRKDMPKELWLECHKDMDEEGADSVYSRMWWDRPAPTMTTRCTSPSSGRFIHPEQDRGITVREAARIQTFPDDFEFPSVKKDASRLVGNAVPPRLIKNIVSKFLESHHCGF